MGEEGDLPSWEAEVVYTVSELYVIPFTRYSRRWRRHDEGAVKTASMSLRNNSWSGDIVRGMDRSKGANDAFSVRFKDVALYMCQKSVA